ncbi:MAG: permease [Thermodesulfobacteriota bacterium]
MIKKIFSDKSLWVFTAIALLSGYGCYVKGGNAAVLKGLKAAWSMVELVGPRLVAAFFLAGFVQVLLPRELIIKWVGAQSGLRGIIIASAVGVITPGGPMLSFPLVAALFKLGAGFGPLVAYLTSWETLSFYRIAVWDLPFMGIKFTLLRYAVSLLLPLVAGLSAQRLSRFFENPNAAEKG